MTGPSMGGVESDARSGGLDAAARHDAVAGHGAPGLALGDVSAVLEHRGTITIVELDEPASGVPGRLAVAYAGVVVGVSRSGLAGRAPTSVGRDVMAGVDLVLVPEEPGPVRPSPGAPWVAVADVDAELTRLTEVVARSPMAAVTLMQVLRGGTASSLEHDLLVESLAYSALQSGGEFLGWLAARPAARPHGAQIDAPVLLDRAGSRLTVTLNRPQVRNAYNVALRDGLDEAFELVAADPGIEEVRLVGAGQNFCSGGDLDEFGTGPGPAASHLVRIERSPVLRLSAVADRVTVELHGACVGAGIEIPALAGRVVALADTRVRLPEVEMGLIPGAGGTATLPRRIGRHRTAWLGLSGAWLDAPTGLEWGLFDEVAQPARTDYF